MVNRNAEIGDLPEGEPIVFGSPDTVNMPIKVLDERAGFLHMNVLQGEADDGTSVRLDTTMGVSGAALILTIRRPGKPDIKEMMDFMTGVEIWAAMATARAVKREEGAS